jgi:hypothetical protein
MGEETVPSAQPLEEGTDPASESAPAEGQAAGAEEPAEPVVRYVGRSDIREFTPETCAGFGGPADQEEGLVWDDSNGKVVTLARFKEALGEGWVQALLDNREDFAVEPESEDPRTDEVEFSVGGDMPAGPEE